MRKKIVVPLSTEGIEQLQKEIRDFKFWQEEKARELTQRCAKLGADVAYVGFARAEYTGQKDVSVTVTETKEGYTVQANGKTVLFIEFGAGIRYGAGHPENSEHGMGPGTYPEGKGHWDSPNGWYIPGGQHTYGNPPAMPMYEARKTIERELPRIVKEVFGW